MNSFETSREGASVPPDNGVSFCRRADPYPRASGQVLSDIWISIGLYCWNMFMLSTNSPVPIVFKSWPGLSSGVDSPNFSRAHSFLKSWFGFGTETSCCLVVIMFICMWEYYVLQALPPQKKFFNKHPSNEFIQRRRRYSALS